MSGQTAPTPEQIEAACRKDYDNRYHKVKADVGYEHYRHIFTSAANFGYALAKNQHTNDQ